MATLVDPVSLELMDLMVPQVLQDSLASQEFLVTLVFLVIVDSQVSPASRE